MLCGATRIQKYIILPAHIAKYVLCNILSIDEMQPYLTHFAILFLLKNISQ